jgi:ABC-type proline/glycine betaine transport system permease subunit
MLSGAVPAILIALAVDRALSVMERRLEKKK